MKSGIANAVQEQVFEFESLIADLKQQKQSFARTKTTEDKKYAMQR